MHIDPGAGLSPPPRGRRRREVSLALLRSGLTSAAILVAYFVLPLSATPTGEALVRLVVGLLALGGLLWWQVRGIVTSPYPRARAVGALAVSTPLFLVVFSTTYYVLGVDDAANWSEPLSRLDALYFTVTVFATVGFGDIVALTEVARAVTTLQMVGDVILVGLIVRVIVGAMQEGVRRRAGDSESPRQHP